jgi:hypothetical protein
MSRQSRIKEYSNPTRAANWQGAGRDQKNLDRFSERATENSYHGGGDKGARDTGVRAEAKADKNDAGSSFMRGIRRNA